MKAYLHNTLNLFLRVTKEKNRIKEFQEIERRGFEERFKEKKKKKEEWQHKHLIPVNMKK